MAILRMLPLACAVLAAALCTPGCDIVSQQEFKAAISTYDADRDGYINKDEGGSDCNDDNDAIHPGAEEICDGIDNDCNGAPSAAYEVDEDGDGYLKCHLEEGLDPLGGFLGGSDCDDTDSGINPATVWYADIDQDTFGDPSGTPLTQCVQPSGYVLDNTDCNDDDDTINPVADEYCDEIDQDCDGVGPDPESTDALLWYADVDLDGFGDAATETPSCEAPSGMVADNTDCDDTVATSYPGADEVCNGADDNCDGGVDEDTAVDALTWYADTDADTYGDPAVTHVSCVAPSGYLADDTDCNDGDANINPGVDELCSTVGVDDDCDTEIDEDSATDAQTFYEDADGDSYGDPLNTSLSCAASSGATDTGSSAPAALIESGTLVHSDAITLAGCGTLSALRVTTDITHSYRGDLQIQLSSPAGTVVILNASNLVDSAHDFLGIWADAGGDFSPHEALSTFAGEDSAGAWTLEVEDTYVQEDDGEFRSWGVTAICGSPTVTDATDCDDAVDTSYPGADEVCNGADDNCDGAVDEDTAVDALTWYADTDADTYGDPAVTLVSCVAPSSYVADDTDCNDADANINPGVQELCSTPGVDDDCDAQFDEDDAGDVIVWFIDADNDTFGDQNGPVIPACIAPNGYVLLPGDCDDTRDYVYPGATEICDGGDTNCDGDTTTPPFDEDDSDGDGYVNCVVDPTVDWLGTGNPQGGDCDDNNAQVNPASNEICDGIDNDCDTLIDDADSSLDTNSWITWYPDSDGDSYGDYTSNGQAACDAPSGYVDNNHDCNEADSTFHGNTYYTDSDLDGYGDSAAPVEAYELDCPTTAPTGFAELHDDCDDSLDTRYPGAVEDCNNTVDNDCDGDTGAADSDCSSCSYQDDENTDSTCSDGVDNDCANGIDCADSACSTTSYCNQSGGYESTCYDGQDNDNDGLTDCCDPDCSSQCSSTASVCNGGGSGGVVSEDGSSELTCYDNLDNDNDGDVDCCDLDCAQHSCCLDPTCAENNGPNGTNSCIATHCTTATDCNDSICTDTFTALCGDPTPTNTVAVPSTIPDFTQLTCGALHTCGRTSGGQVDCWGDNAASQSSIPGAAQTLSFTGIVAGAEHTCGLAEDSNGDEKVVCWGDNSLNQSGTSCLNGLCEGWDPQGTSIMDITAGYYHSCAIDDGGTIECWGDNTHGQTDKDGAESAAAGNGANGLESITAGGYHTCGLDDLGYLHCWGRNDFNQVGDYSTGQGPNGSNSTTYSFVAAGELHTCALKTNGYLDCWGEGTLGQTNYPTRNTNYTDGNGQTYTINSFSTAADTLTASGHHTCVKANITLPSISMDVDTVVCWGWDSDDQVVDAPATTSGTSGDSTPAYMQSSTPGAVCSGARHNCIYYNSGDLECFGDNCQGQACTTSTCSTGTCN